MESSGGWQPHRGAADGVYGPAGDFLTGNVGTGGWTGLDPPGTAALRPRRRRVARFLALAALTWLAGLAALAVLTIVLLSHGGLLAWLLGLITVAALLFALGMAVLLWVGRRAWRSGAWLELGPVAAGMPGLGRVIWAVRALVVGRAFWRLGRRAGRPWFQPRAGGLSGTTR
jgi:hypothetical protein